MAAPPSQAGGSSSYSLKFPPVSRSYKAKGPIASLSNQAKKYIRSFYPEGDIGLTTEERDRLVIETGVTRQQINTFLQNERKRLGSSTDKSLDLLRKREKILFSEFTAEQFEKLHELYDTDPTVSDLDARLWALPLSLSTDQVSHWLHHRRGPTASVTADHPPTPQPPDSFNFHFPTELRSTETIKKEYASQVESDGFGVTVRPQDEEDELMEEGEDLDARDSRMTLDMDTQSTVHLSTPSATTSPEPQPKWASYAVRPVLTHDGGQRSPDMSVLRSPSASSVAGSDIPPRALSELQIGTPDDPGFGRFQRASLPEFFTHSYGIRPSDTSVRTPMDGEARVRLISPISTREMIFPPTPVHLPSSSPEALFPPSITSVPASIFEQIITKPPKPPLSEREVYIQQFRRVLDGFDFTREKTSELVPEGTDVMELIRQQKAGFARVTEEMRRHTAPFPEVIPASGST